MAIEPLSSAMTYQAQPIAKVQPVTTVNTEVPADGETINIDATTASVTKAQAEEEKENGSESNGSSGQQSAGNTQQTAGKPKQLQNSQDQLKKAIAEMNKKINNANQEAIFGLHEDTNRVMIKIVDKETKETIKEYPPEKTLDMIARIWEMAGILVDEKL